MQDIFKNISLYTIGFTISYASYIMTNFGPELSSIELMNGIVCAYDCMFAW